MAKADNLLAVLWLLRSRRKMTAGQLAEALETSVRTVYRYIDALCASGVPVIADTGPDGGYSLPENFRGAPLFFEPTELVALFQAADFAREGGHPHSEALGNALEKIRRTLAPEQSDLVARHTAAFRVEPPRRGRPAGPWLASLETAVADSETVRIAYKKPADQVPEDRTIDPYGIFYRNGFWYLIAHCHARQDLREFRVDRIQGLTPTGARFSRPDGFDLGEYMTISDMAEQTAQSPPVLMRLEGEPSAIASACDHHYFRRFVVEHHPREALFRIDRLGVSWFYGYLLGFGRTIRILEPDWLRADLRRLAQDCLEHHVDPEPISVKKNGDP